jgi:GAF domain-containing protein
MNESDRERAERFLDLFNQGREFTEELLRENERLRHQVALLEQSSRGEEVDTLRRNLERLARENREIRERFARVEEQNLEYMARYQEIEEQNNNLANLYVASYQLHSTLDFAEVIEIVKEIMINLIGAEAFSVLLFDHKAGAFETVAFSGAEIVAGIDLLSVRSDAGPYGRVAVTRESYYTDEELRGRTPSVDRPIAVVPLKINEQVIGLLAIYSVFEQKHAFTAVDYELFSLLAAHAAAAIFSSRLYSQSERKLNTIQGFLDLLTTT